MPNAAHSGNCCRLLSKAQIRSEPCSRKIDLAAVYRRGGVERDRRRLFRKHGMK